MSRARCVNQPLSDQGGVGPEKPSVRSILAAITIFERDRAGSGRELCGFGDRCRFVLRVDEIDRRRGQQLILGVAESPFPGGIYPHEVPLEGRDAEHIERECEEAVQLLLHSPALDHCPDLVTGAGHHLKKLFVRLPVSLD